MNLIQRMKQHFCHHDDNPDNRNHQVPFVGYEFQCPKCKAHVAYFQSNDSYMNMSELQYNTVIEEGKKLWALEWHRKEERDGD